MWRTTRPLTGRLQNRSRAHRSSATTTIARPTGYRAPAISIRARPPRSSRHNRAVASLLHAGAEDRPLPARAALRSALANAGRRRDLGAEARTRAVPQCHAASGARGRRAPPRPRLAPPNPTLRDRRRNDNLQEWQARPLARPGTDASSPAGSCSSHRRSRGSSPSHSRSSIAASARPRGGIQPIDFALIVGRRCVFLILVVDRVLLVAAVRRDRKSTRLNSSHSSISYAVFC